MCDIFYYPAACDPKGHGSSAASNGFYMISTHLLSPIVNFPQIRPECQAVLAGHLVSLPPPAKRKKDQKGKTKEKRHSVRPAPGPATRPSPWPSPVQARTPFLFTSDAGALGGVSSGGGGGDLHPLSACRTSRFSRQTLACAKWEPRTRP